MRGFFLVLILFAWWSSASADEGKLKRWFSDIDAFFTEHVKDGMIDYKAIRNNPMELMQLIHRIEEVEIAEYDQQTQKAFWINAYNILVIGGIITEYPVSSPLDIEGFFKANKHKAAGEWLTLDDIENKKLMGVYEDARLHFALVCAARGCPALTEKAYIPEGLDEQLTMQTRKTLNSNEFVRIGEDKVLVSEMFKWYQDDFLKDAPSIRAYINRYREVPLQDGAAIDYYTYDWSLNEKKK